MKKNFEKEDIARLITFLVPVGLILIVLIISLIVQGVKHKKSDTDAIQNNIIDYADANLPEEGTLSEERPMSTSEQTESTTEEETESQPTTTPVTTVSPSPSREEEVDYSKITFDKDEQLKEMMEYWAQNNQKALDDLANLDRFKAMSWKLKGTTDCYYYGETSSDGKANGTGIAVYADNQYYYGQWSQGVRSGDGTWMHYHMHAKAVTTDLYTFHSYTGQWKNDLPNGDGSEHYDFVMSNLKPNIGYNRNLIGTYQDGLYNGSFYITNLYSDENVKEWNATAVKGSWNYIDDVKDTAGRKKVQVETINDENFIWMFPKDNQNLGVQCLISSKK